MYITLRTFCPLSLSFILLWMVGTLSVCKPILCCRTPFFSMDLRNIIFFIEFVSCNPVTSCQLYFFPNNNLVYKLYTKSKPSLGHSKMTNFERPGRKKNTLKLWNNEYANISTTISHIFSPLTLKECTSVFILCTVRFEIKLISFHVPGLRLSVLLKIFLVQIYCIEG